MPGQTGGARVRRASALEEGRRRRRRVVSCGVVALLAASAVLGSRPAAAQPLPGCAITAGAVVAAFRHAGLTIEGVQRQPVSSAATPGGPPPTARSAWGFVVGGHAHGDGRILLFSTLRGRDLKAARFQRVEAHILVHHRVLVWLDHRSLATVVARAGRALAGVV